MVWNSSKRRADISWECIANIINTAKGPTSELKKYIKLIENPEQQLALAVKYNIIDIIIEVLN